MRLTLKVIVQNDGDFVYLILLYTLSHLFLSRSIVILSSTTRSSGWSVFFKFSK